MPTPKSIMDDALKYGKEIGMCIWPFLKPHVDYWWCFDDNIQELRDGIRDLDRQTHDIQQRIEVARLRTEILIPEVGKWLEESRGELVEARTTLPNDNIPKAWNLFSRYSMGKRAKKAAEKIAKHLDDGNFDTISDPAPPASMASTSQTQTMDFESRKRIEEEIMESLRNSSISTIAICGVGGVGKTTMVERIRKKVKEERRFDEIVMVVVGQQVDMLKIQEEIAEWLKLKFDEKHMSTRAAKLRARLMDTKRKIIILDDVWESLRFEDLGIPIESNFEGCKVILTSRSRDTCKRIKNKKVFELKILEGEEAWILFKEKAGKCVEDSALLPVAKHVAAECKSLPIALVTVGTALQDETDIYKWKDSLSQLRKSNPTDFSEVLRDVYKPLKLSYDYLDNNIERDLFLMCCLFPEDYDIPIQQLTWYSMGLPLFDDILTIEESRNRTHGLVGKLKSRFLLMDGSDKLHVKMHDVVRDVAIYIGLKENNGFLKSLHRMSTENSSDVNCNWISVDISNLRMEVPLVSLFPNLQLLMLLISSPNDFSDISFEGMKNVNVLSIRGRLIRMKDLNVPSFRRSWIGSLPPSLESLKNLQTLCLFRCQVQNISVIGKLTSLKILSCYGCDNIMELPAAIGRLSGLILLELNRCRKLQRIPFGVTSSLRLLEELKIRRSFSRWEAEENGKERSNASLTELECLPNLTCLEIEIDDCTLSAQEICLSLNLVKYYIGIGSKYFSLRERDYEKEMKLNLTGAVGNWIRLLARNAECLSVRGDGSDNINLAEMENLRNLQFTYCSTVKKLVDMTSYQNQNVSSLCNLKSIYIGGCSNLKHVFSVSVARTRLLQLEFLGIDDCAAMEQVFWIEIRDDRDSCIDFPKLKELTLFSLPNLTALCQGLENNIIIKFPNLTHMEIGGLPKLNSLFPLNSETLENTCFHFVCKCNPKIEMGDLKHLSLDSLGDNIRNIWCHQIPNNVFSNLEILKIHSMNGIRSLMSTSIAKNLVSLKHLKIGDCREMVEVIERDVDDKKVVDIKSLFPTLRVLRIWNLNKLRRFWQWNHALELPLLEDVDIYNCPAMETFTLGSINTPNRRKIQVNNEKIDDQKDLNDIIRYIWTESLDTFMAENDGDWDEDEEKNESKDEYNNENVNKDEDDNERK